MSPALPPPSLPLGAFLLLDGQYHWMTLKGIIAAAKNRTSVIIYALPDVRTFTQLDASNLGRTYFVDPKQLSGILLSFAEQGLQKYAIELHRNGHAVCLVARIAEDVPHVLCDNHGAIFRTVTALIQRGHRKIAFVDGPLGNHSARERLEAFRQAHHDAKIPFDPLLIIPPTSADGETQGKMAAFLKTHRPTAILSFNDMVAIGALSAVAEAGLAIPEEIEIFGFDNIMRSRWTSPPLSTHLFDRFQMAFVATDELLRRTQGLPYRASVRIPAEPVDRGTSRNAPSTEINRTENSQSRFFCEVQLAELKQHPEIREKLLSLGSLKLSGSEFINTLDEVIQHIDQTEGDTTILFSWLNNLAVPHDHSLLPALRVARERISDSALNQQLKHQEDALQFTSATEAIRELAFRAADETAVLAAFEQVLKVLTIHIAGIYLLSQNESVDDFWYPWNNIKTTFLSGPELITRAKFNLPELLKNSSASCWFAMPLLYNGESFGMVVLDTRSRFLQNFPDLVRYFSAALHGSRMFVALRKTNEARREAQAKAEQFAADLLKSHQALTASEYFYHSLVESLPQGIVRKDRNGICTYINSPFAALLGRPANMILGKSDEDFYSPGVAARHRSDEQRVMQSLRPLEYEDTLTDPSGKKRFLHIKKIPLQDQSGAGIGVQVLYWDITSFRETEELLKQAQHELIEASRLAGVAEIATNVLHTIGNALNSVTTSTSLILAHVQNSKVSSLVKLAELVSSQSDVGAFLTRDPKGLALPKYLRQLAHSFKEDQASLLDETRALQESTARVAEVVASQQSHAQVTGVKEAMDPRELLECALRLSDSFLEQQNIVVVREYNPTRLVVAQRHKVLQILTKLIKNGAEAMETATDDRKRLAVGYRQKDSSRLQIYVHDNGGGISAENLTRIFEYGFTTKKTGRGFNLHGSAIAASEMDGTLHASSDGLEKGATFVLTLPSEAELDSKEPLQS